MFREVSLAFLAIFALNASALKIPGQCPQEPYPVIQNFTESSYFGDWYLIERYDNWWQQGLDCNKINYGLNPNNSYSVLVESQLRNNVPEYNSVLGYGVLSFPLANPPTGQWNQSFYGSPPDRVNYNILATDYDTFSVVWGCDNISDTEKEGEVLNFDLIEATNSSVDF